MGLRTEGKEVDDMEKGSLARTRLVREVKGEGLLGFTNCQVKQD